MRCAVPRGWWREVTEGLDRAGLHHRGGNFWEAPRGLGGWVPAAWGYAPAGSDPRLLAFDVQRAAGIPLLWCPVIGVMAAPRAVHEIARTALMSAEVHGRHMGDAGLWFARAVGDLSPEGARELDTLYALGGLQAALAWTWGRVGGWTWGRAVTPAKEPPR